uniref:Putative secreted peptide n=1 Tax=Anopheles braziliensis TaxID=58242 RepID=A0A2M3ZSA2_9DIPT
MHTPHRARERSLAFALSFLFLISFSSVTNSEKKGGWMDLRDTTTTTFQQSGQSRALYYCFHTKSLVSRFHDVSKPCVCSNRISSTL